MPTFCPFLALIKASITNRAYFLWKKSLFMHKINSYLIFFILFSINSVMAKSNSNLSDLQKHVIFENGTEKPFDNKYWNNDKEGIYVDIVDGQALFSSKDKFDSGTGWPSFTNPIDKEIIKEKSDYSHGMMKIL